MMGLGGQELIVIFLIILLLFGAKKLPELAKGVGKSMGEFNKAKQEFEHEIKRAQVDAEKEIEPPKATQPATQPAKESEKV